MKKSKSKIQHGQFFTKTNPFTLIPFKQWISKISDFENRKFIEPFAGSNNLVKMIHEIGFSNLKWGCYDIDPKSKNVIRNDSILNYPKGYEKGVCITNPPYLAKNSAKRMKLDFPETDYDDLYKLALERCVKNTEHVAAIIPESFITSNLFHSSLEVVVSLNFEMFEDTDCPVCLALFSKNKEDSNNFDIWIGNEYIGKYEELKDFIPHGENSKVKVVFNDKNGKLGLQGVDNTKKASIEFIRGNLIPSKDIKVSSRALTRISFDKKTELNIEKYGSDKFIKELNKEISKFREKTRDVFMTSFKGLREDNYYRRRLDFSMAKKIIITVINRLFKEEN